MSTLGKKRGTRFVCASCGAVSPKWLGRCESCGEWNSMQPDSAPATRGAAANVAPLHLTNMRDPIELPARQPVGMDELDRVLGGGFVPGSVVLVGGDPGIGKSTLLLQAAARMAMTGRRTIYVTGEESLHQVKLRGQRLGVEQSGLDLAANTDVREICAGIRGMEDIGLLVIDSIQTMRHDEIEGSAGSVSQVRGSAFELISLAKERNLVLILVGHVTKEGGLAGPRVLEHMVDVVLYFEGDRGHQFRILRAAKNRYGATAEIGVFEMTESGLHEVASPSALFIAERRGEVAGSAVFAGVEGSRAMLLEVQALVLATGGTSPRRSVLGWDSGRLAMMLAVLESRCGLKLGGADVYLNIAGGMRVGEPAADLAIAAALTSAATSRPTNPSAVYFGEIGLSGEIRQVPQVEKRLAEAAKLGFSRAVLPRRPEGRGFNGSAGTMKLTEIGHLSELVDHFTGADG